MPTVQLFARNVYGVAKADPANIHAKHFADLLGVKTFSAHQMRHMKLLGFEIEFVADAKTVLMALA